MKAEPKSKYNHAEAFNLMSYKCEKCGTLEVLWNSRDGVTPFIIGCRCGGSMQHIDWHKDIRIEDYIPRKGQRIFIDIPESLKKPIALKRIDIFKSTPHEVKEAEKEKVMKSIIDGMQKGEPYVITWEW